MSETSTSAADGPDEAASPFRNRMAFDLDVDICVVGAGLAGLTVAREAARLGASVAVLEGRQVGWNASGHHLGTVMPGFGLPISDVVERVGLDDARELWALSKQGADYVRATATEELIPGINPSDGALEVSNVDVGEALISRLQMLGEELATEVEGWQVDRVRSVLRTGRYFHGIYYPRALQIDGRKYVHGLAALATRAGVRIFEETPVVSIDFSGIRKRIVTPSARLRANHIVLAGNIHLGAPLKRLSDTLLPVWRYAALTEPLGERLAEAIAFSGSVADSDGIDHFRIVDGDRLLWYNSDPTKSTVGTITINFPHGGTYDMVSTNSIRSGKIAAYLELRDNTLVQAQAQIDQFAAAMSSALSDKTTAGTAATSGAQSGFDLDLSGLQNGNTIHLSYKDNATGLTHNLSIIRVNDPSVLPLSNTATVDPNDEVLGVDFSGGMSSVLAQLNGALGGTGLQFSNPSGSTLRVLDDGAANKADVTAASVTTTASSLTSGDPQLPLFTDNGALYTGAISANGSQSTGLAGRISVNTALVGDPSRMVVYSTNPQTPAGDTTRANLILSQLSNASYSYSPQTGLGTTGAPFTGTLLNFAKQFISQQGESATAAKQLADGQDVVLNTLQSKMDSTSGVNMDDEMAHLLSLQNAYSANARVMSTIKQMYDALLQLT